MMAFRIARSSGVAVALLGLCVLGCLVAEVSVLAQTAQGVSVEFLVLSAGGAPVTDLRPEDVTVVLDGEPRPIQSLRFSRLSGPPGGAADEMPPPFGTGQTFVAGRTVVLAAASQFMDSAAARAAAGAIDQFLGRLSPRDRVGLLTVPESTTRVDLTADLAVVREALPGMAAAASVSREAAAIEACAPRAVLEALGRSVSGFRDIDGPKALVFFASSFSGSPAAPSAVETQSCYLADDYEHLAEALAAEQVHLYVVQASASAAGRDPGLASLAGLAGDSPLLLVSPSAADALDAIALETSAYYVATFEPPVAERDGGAHELEVRVARPDVTTRAHATVVIDAPTAVDEDTRPSVTEMLHTQTQFPGLPLRVSSYTSRGLDARLRLLVVAETVDPSIELTAGAVGLIDDAGAVQQVTLSDEQRGASPIILLLEAAPGAYRLRFAGTARDGSFGVADVAVAAQLTPAEPYSLSGMVLGGVRAGAFVPVMQFRDEPIVIVYFELYGERAGGLAATVELATSPTDPPIATFDPVASRTEMPDKIILTAEIPIDALEPGDYLVRAVISPEGHPSATIVRTLRKVR